MSIQKRVLIVEDDVRLVRALTLKLESQGFVVTAVSDGQEALDALKQSSYNVMLLDLLMPAMDGFQTLQQIRDSKLSVPYIIVVSNLSLQEDRDRALALGASKYFIKSNTSLSMIIQEVRNASGMGGV